MARSNRRDTLDRRRAEHAYQRLSEVRNLKKLCGRLQGFPVEVRSQGLTVAIATLLKEDRAESRELAGLIADWVLGAADVIADSDKPRDPSRIQLLEKVISSRRPDYLALQAEVLAYLEHAKRLASALVTEAS